MREAKDASKQHAHSHIHKWTWLSNTSTALYMPYFTLKRVSDANPPFTDIHAWCYHTEHKHKLACSLHYDLHGEKGGRKEDLNTFLSLSLSLSVSAVVVGILGFSSLTHLVI